MGKKAWGSGHLHTQRPEEAQHQVNAVALQIVFIDSRMTWRPERSSNRTS